MVCLLKQDNNTTHKIDGIDYHIWLLFILFCVNQTLQAYTLPPSQQCHCPSGNPVCPPF